MKKVYYIGIVLVSLIIVGGVSYYLWYNTPRIVYDKTDKLFMTAGNVSRYGRVRTANITYRNDVCIVHEIIFFEMNGLESFANISRDDVLSILNQGNMKIIKEEKMDINYIKLTVAQKDGKIVAIVLYNNKTLVSVSCQKGNEEYISRWFVEKYE